MANRNLRETYEGNWTEVLNMVRRYIATGERSLSRVLRLTEAEWRGMDDIGPAKGTSFGELVVMPRAAIYGARQTLRMRVLSSLCKPETGAVIELGAGWGNNLADLYLSGGPLEAHYHALEITDSGRECAKLLAGLEPDYHLSVTPFDYREPNYDTISSFNWHVLVFTSHSIETIPHVSEEAITGLLTLGRSVTCAHFEPIGWQIRENKNGIGSTRDYSLRCGYNQNLWNVLSDLQDRKLITIETALPDLFHHKTYNASSLVIWRSSTPE